MNGNEPPDRPPYPPLPVGEPLLGFIKFIAGAGEAKPAGEQETDSEPEEPGNGT